MRSLLPSLWNVPWFSFFFLNDSLWNFPSNQHSKVKGSYFHLDPEAPTLSLRRRACKLERLYPYSALLQSHWAACLFRLVARMWQVWLGVRGVKYMCLHKTCYILFSPLSWTCLERPTPLQALALLRLSSWPTVSSHKATFSQASCPSPWDWGRKDQRCCPNRQAWELPFCFLPMPPSTPSQHSCRLGKHSLPEIGRLCFHSSSKGPTLASFCLLILYVVFLTHKQISTYWEFRIWFPHCLGLYQLLMRLCYEGEFS